MAATALDGSSKKTPPTLTTRVTKESCRRFKSEHQVQILYGLPGSAFNKIVEDRNDHGIRTTRHDANRAEIRARDAAGHSEAGPAETLARNGDFAYVSARIECADTRSVVRSVISVQDSSS